MKKQIEEMRGLIHEEIKKAVDSGLITWTEFAQYLTERLTEQRYRKQSEGAWKKSAHGKYDYFCSACGVKAMSRCYGNHDDLSKFCPNCGAQMKGE